MNTKRVRISPAFDGFKAAVLRTLIPATVALLINAAAHLGIKLDNGTAETIATYLVTLIGTTAYYIGVRMLERFSSSRWGWLLGYPQAPVYPKPTDGAPVIEGEVVRPTPAPPTPDEQLK